MKKRQIGWMKARLWSFSGLAARSGAQCIMMLLASFILPGPAVGGEPGTLPPSDDKPKDIFDMSMEELKRLSVTGASKREQKVSEAPAAVVVLTSEDVKRFGYRTLADLLQSVPGLSVSYDRNRALLGSRGFNPGDANNRVLILVDGHRVNHNLRDEGYIGTDALLDVDLIDTVEVIRGPGSILYGNNAFFGVINIHTRRGKDLKTLEVSSEAGEFGTYKGRATFGNLFKNGVELLLSGSYYTSEGEKRISGLDIGIPQPAPNNGIVDEADGDMFKSFFGSLSYNDFALQGAYLTREKVNPTAPLGTVFNDPRSRWADQRDYVNLKYAHPFPGVVDVTATVYYDRNDFSLGYPFPGAPGAAGQFLKEFQEGEWWGGEIQLSREFRERLNVTLGAEYRDDFRQELQVVEPVTGQVFAAPQRTTANHGVYLQGDLMVVTNLHFNAGVRYDQYGTSDAAFNPRLALIYNPWKDAAVKAIYGSAFRAPNFFELNNPGSPVIRPETITSYELVYEQGITENIRSTASVFYNEIEDLITLSAVNFGYQNLNSASAKGTELGLEGHWSGGVRGRLSYTFQETKDAASSRTLTDSPRHMFKTSLSVPLVRENLYGSAEVLFMSERTTWAGTSVDPHAIVNFTLFSQNLARGLELSASVYNVFDTRFFDPARPALHQLRQDQIVQEGRSYRIKLVYAF